MSALITTNLRQPGHPAAEIDVRCGNRTLQYFDLEDVDDVNLNRMAIRNTQSVACLLPPSRKKA
ncbi:MAG TPA: hypothetical protein VKK79_00460 [Candidatus Lokiarchaeia archaeon]|nr:hypothetical protein [Candidatus Lokiarchaeia archaeon]